MGCNYQGWRGLTAYTVMKGKEREVSTNAVRTEYADMKYWEELAKKKSLRLPQSKTPLTTSKMEQLLRLCGWTLSRYQEWSGFRTLKGFITANPTWSARAFCGLLLEG